MKTSYYSYLKNLNLEKFQPIAISGDEGKLAGFSGKAMKKLSPYCFFRKWKNKENELEEALKTGSLTKDDFDQLKAENQKNYIESFYNKVLKPLDPKQIYDELGENAVLLCFEKPTEFCHRFLVASWFELCLGVQIDEAGFENDKDVAKNKENLKNKLRSVMNKSNDKNRGK